jgi:hypothetical protein
MHFQPQDGSIKLRVSIKSNPPMSRLRKTILTIAAVLASMIIVAAFPVGRLYLRTSIPGRVVRWCLGEPGATQWVNDTIDRITYWHATAELQETGDRLVSEFAPINSTLPDAPFSRGKAIPSDRLPEKYRKLGGIFGDHPQLILETKNEGIPAVVIISWGHGRQSIWIFSAALSSPPGGFFVRKLNSRIYVIAGES